MGSLGGAEILVLAILFLLPMAVLYRVAKARGQSGAYAWWGVLSLLGLVIGLLMLIAMPQRVLGSTGKPSSGPPDVF